LDSDIVRSKMCKQIILAYKNWEDHGQRTVSSGYNVSRY
jgi:phosphate starvation-inducible protein PhoH